MITGRDTEPYVGLRPYTIDDAHRFFGRRRESAVLTSWVVSTRLVVAYGADGVGKTSLIQAGVLPHLYEYDARALPVGSLPHASALPLDPTAGVNPFTDELLSYWAPEIAPRRRRGLTLPYFLADHPVELDDYGDPRTLVAVVDQFEEILVDSPYRAPERDELLRQLAQALDTVPYLHVLLVTRQSGLGRMPAVERMLFPGSRRRFEIGAFGRDAAIEAVTLPLGPTRRWYAQDAVDALVDRLVVTTFTDEIGGQRTLATDAIEPINLQVICLSLWRSLTDDVTEITAEIVARHLEDPSDLEATLTSFCARAVMEVAAVEALPETVVWDWLDRTFITDLGMRASEHQGRFETGGMPSSVAKAFEARNILKSEKRLDSVSFELVHDVLVSPIRHGRRLSERLAARVEAGEGGPHVGVGPEAYLRMARAAVREGLLRQAQVYAEGAVATSEDDARANAEAHAFLGQLLFEHAQAATSPQADAFYAAAEGSWRRAAEVFEAEQDPEAAGQQLASLGRLFMAMGRYGDAVGQLGNALERARDMRIRLDFARALRFAGHRRAALGEYTRVIASSETALDGLVERGILGAEHGDAAVALRDLDAAVQVQPELARRPDVIEARRHASARLEGA